MFISGVSSLNPMGRCSCSCHLLRCLSDVYDGRVVDCELKQRGNLFYPGWAWSLCTRILGVPYSLIEVVVWTYVVYYSIGFALARGRFFSYMVLLLMLLCWWG
ncbi:ABC transporter G family member 31 [Spatholobus suberectus]|nr:ABC transporter G family member 31 [Spatholobus suberectus]